MSNQSIAQEDRALALLRIKELFDSNVRGKFPSLSDSSKSHDGSDGHWLQVQFELEADNKNAPDIFGFELKNGTKTKTTFGDWTADEYVFFSHQACKSSAAKAARCSKCSNSKISRDEFFQIFATPNPKKNNRLSWSGEVFPKVGKVNKFGQVLTVQSDGEVRAEYSFEEDQRLDKNRIVPADFRNGRHILGRWKAATLQSRLEEKFKVNGWIKCVRSQNGAGPYSELWVGAPIRFEDWIASVKNGEVYLDSGMYQGNNRPYQSWRANNNYWELRVIERY